MGRSPYRDTKLKCISRNALTDKADDPAVFMRGVDTSFDYEELSTFKMKEIKIV